MPRKTVSGRKPLSGRKPSSAATLSTSLDAPPNNKMVERPVAKKG